MSSSSSEHKVYNQALVSICIPTHNAEKTIMSTVRSIRNQSYQNLEILVVDNASTDNTLALLREFNDPRITIYRNAINIGAENNFSKCIQLANGEYIGIFHADDLYMPDMVEKQVQAFRDNPTIGAVFTMANLINSQDEVIGEWSLPAELRGKRIYYFPEIFVSILENLNFLICPSAMVRSEIYKKLAPFDVERFRTSADLDMWLRILEKYPIAIFDDKMMSYRISNIHGNYQFGYLRIEQADFFRVMDWYLSVKSDALNIPQTALSKYELLRSIDNIRCAVNYLIKGQVQEAHKLLKRAFSVIVFRGAAGSIRKPKFLAYWFVGLMLLGLVHLGLGPYLRKVMHWLLYRWKRRFV